MPARRKYNNLTIEELKEKFDLIRVQQHRVDKSAVELLKKNKRLFINEYAREELNADVKTVFDIYEDLDNAIEFVYIFNNWHLAGNSALKSLHPEIIFELNNSNSEHR